MLLDNLEMFSSREHLEKRTGPYGIGRLSYLQSLVSEFQDTDSEESKLQILANLANFAYDPINYEHFRALNILDLFLDCLSNTESLNPELIEYALGGVCNCIVDQENRDYLLQNNCVPPIVNCLSSNRLETVITAMTTIVFLASGSQHRQTNQQIQQLVSLPIVDAMLRFSQSRNPRVSNLANVYLTDCCNQETISTAKEMQRVVNK